MQKIIFFLFFTVSSVVGVSQPICAFDEKMAELIATNPQYAQEYQATEEKIKTYIAAHPPGKTTSLTERYNIPVVVHVMHTGGAPGTIYNPSDATILNAISYLNQVFAGTYSGMEAPVGGTAVVNMQLNFVMAQRTPTCGYTNGIDRVNASALTGYAVAGVKRSGSTGCSDLELKNFARWNPADYYNIWVVNMIDGLDGTAGQFVAGYAYFAGASASVDGTVMLATAMAPGRKTLPHEIGHAFNLYHSFEGSALNTACPANASCTADGDRVCDTDPVTNNVNDAGTYDFSCRTGLNACTGTSFTKNTENNFMSYTNCYRLFTEGQKARVQAAMSLDSRAGFLTSLGGTPCGTVLNFSAAADSEKENNTGSSIDCRKYSDYNYSVSIGSAPAANTIVNLSFSGTAKKGFDYEVTTNGNFTTPENILYFNAGATTAQPFTVRVFDDAASETAETVILNFTINNNGGNATIGTTAPTLTLTIEDNDAAPFPPSNLNAGVGTYNINLTQPFRGSYFDSRTQVLYTADELAALGFTAGYISTIGFNVLSKGSTQPYNEFSIKLKNTTVTSLSSSAFETGTTSVYTGNYSTVAGLNTIPITPFLWDGRSNLLLDFCFDNSTGSGDDLIEGSASVANTYFDRQSTNITSGCAIPKSSFIFSTGARPIFIFGLSTLGNDISTALNSSKTAYLGPNDDVCFYDDAGNIMARIKNLTDYDYGCTSVSIDRAGSGTAQFWNNSPTNYLMQKSLRVVHANNNATNGNYEVTLYYAAQEVKNWETATGLAFAAANLVKVSEKAVGYYIPDVSPTVPRINEVAMVAGTASAFGSNYTITGNFMPTASSGFGVGVPGNPILTAQFRTKSGGNFSDAGLWQYNNYGANYADALKIPGADNNMLVQSGHVLALNAVVVCNAGKIFTVDGTLNCGTSILSGAGSFVLSANATLGIGALRGISTSGNTGNIQTTGRSFSALGNYIYNGIGNQTTGNGLPASVNNLTIANTGASGNNVVTLGSALSVNGTTTLSSGELSIGANTLTLGGPLSYGTGLLTGSSASNLTITGNVGSLKFSQTSAASRSLNVLTINSTGRATLGSLLLSAKTVTLKSGAVFTVPAGNNLITN